MKSGGLDLSNNDMSFSQNMTANPTTNLTDQILTEEKVDSGNKDAL